LVYRPKSRPHECPTPGAWLQQRVLDRHFRGIHATGVKFRLGRRRIVRWRRWRRRWRRLVMEPRQQPNPDMRFVYGHQNPGKKRFPHHIEMK
jgi:hypothetical protein